MNFTTNNKGMFDNTFMVEEIQSRNDMENFQILFETTLNSQLIKVVFMLAYKFKVMVFK